ncbi:MFS transporter [Pedobacter sp. SD-b]|uniref:MFS transporter n=1 Tax=Pedobacter segetis TaxID=2793069 RepID=A0ABS1BI07_9SPHI|nr:MFS transporter [Pedobacter segetis]MBK0382518.1 MFS transporter [Pedobacter segetis]
MEIKNNKKTIRAWAMFDWANSAYNLVITSTIFPAYYTAITTTSNNNDKVFFFGFKFVNTALSNYALAVAYLIIAFLTPILTATADYRGNKKTFMMVFTWIGALACAGLYFFRLETLELGVVLFAIAAIGYCGGIVFSNSYLPEIATLDQQDKVSAKGFAYGYIGSVILQIICFVFVLMPDTFGITDASFPARLSFLLVGIWWIGFSYIPFMVLPKASPNYDKLDKKKVGSGFGELKKVWQQVKLMPVLKSFLLAYFFYAMGVQTIMLVAANFGEKILHLGTSKLIATILIIQLVAIIGAYLMSKLSEIYGNLKVLIFVVILWIGVCAAAYFIANEYQFYILAAVVGLIMGGIQSLSRSTFSKYVPEGTPDTASFFSFYDVTEKLAIVAGLFSFGFVEELTGNMRNSALGLGLFFIIGLVLLFTTLKKENQTKLF